MNIIFLVVESKYLSKPQLNYHSTEHKLGLTWNYNNNNTNNNNNMVYFQVISYGLICFQTSLTLNWLYTHHHHHPYTHHRAKRAYSVPKGVRNEENIKHLFTIVFLCYFVITNPLKHKKTIGDLVNPIFFIFTQFLWCKCNARHTAFFV